MANVTPRAALAAILKPLLPEGWKFVLTNRFTDTLSATTVWLKQERITRLPVTPQAAHLIEYTVTIATPLTDFDKAEDRLDDEVNALIHALDVAGIEWTSAEKKLLSEGVLCYDLSVNLISEKDQ